ncbi:hypothetical protein CR513_01408, partial [Mucuna pruriens]
MTVKYGGEIGIESSIGEGSTSSESESLSDGSHYEGALLVVRRLMNNYAEEEDKTQRENIFHSRCLILGNLCCMIIYGEVVSIVSTTLSVASKRLVKKLALPTIVHSRSYKLQWLSEKGELLVVRKAEVTFTLGTYKDKVVCDVVLMDAMHLLLEGP